MQEIFLFFEVFGAHLVSKSMVTGMGVGGQSEGVKELKHEAGLSSPRSTEVKKV